MQRQQQPTRENIAANLVAVACLLLLIAAEVALCVAALSR